MANQLEISHINPISFREIASTQLAQYNSRHIDSFLFSDTLYPWQYPSCFIQPWQRNDTMRQQVVTNIGPVQMRLYPHSGAPYITISFQQKQQDKSRPGRFIYESSYAVSNLTEGFYRPTLVVGGSELWEGEWQWVKDLHEESLLFEYSNITKRQNFHFQASGLVPTLRTFGAVKLDNLNSTDVIYTDEEEDSEMLNSVPYRIWKLYINDSKGTSKTWADKLYRILGCTDLRIDGRFYVKAAEGAVFERIDSEAKQYNAKNGWAIDLRERINKDSFTSVDDIQVVRAGAVVYNVGLRGFGPGTTDAQTGTVLSYE